MRTRNELVTLEASGSESQTIAAAFDRDTGAFSRKPSTGLWAAIDRAHQLGFRGDGQRVAIVDTMYDRSFSFLERRVDRVWSEIGEQGTHGTAVALLISLVAPESRLSFYPIDASPQVQTVRRAIAAAAADGASVINLSLGIRRKLPAYSESALDVGALIGDAHEWFDVHAPDVEGCELCGAAKDAAQNRIVVAAAGNDPAMICCPARAAGVIAVGFQRSTRRTVESPGTILENTDTTDTGHESRTFDIALGEFNGILGTSFASPIYAGIAALGLPPAEMRSYVSSIGPGGAAQIFHMMLRSGERSEGLADAVHSLYLLSLKRLPHVHCELSTRLRPDVAYTDPGACWSCGILAEDRFTNAGLFFLEVGELEQGIGLLTAATAFAPWSYDAAANLGAGYRAMGDFSSAKRWYQRALELRPDFPVYMQTLRQIESEMGDAYS